MKLLVWMMNVEVLDSDSAEEIFLENKKTWREKKIMKLYKAMRMN